MSDETVYRDMFGIGWTADEMDALSKVWVCTRHKRFLPCRTCSAAGGNLPSWHSCEPEDVEAVRRFHGVEGIEKP